MRQTSGSWLEERRATAAPAAAGAALLEWAGWRAAFWVAYAADTREHARLLAEDARRRAERARLVGVALPVASGR